jgi:hypothetical protein
VAATTEKLNHLQQMTQPFQKIGQKLNDAGQKISDIAKGSFQHDVAIGAGSGALVGQTIQGMRDTRDGLKEIRDEMKKNRHISSGLLSSQ